MIQLVKKYESRDENMTFIVDELLENISKQGYTPDELKEVVIAFLEPYFENKPVLVENAMQSHFLSIFSYMVVYKGDSSFAQGLIEVLKYYRNAYYFNAEKVKNIVLETADLMGQKENLMWTVKSNTPNEISDDIHEATYSYMKHIGDVLEISVKHEIIELYAILEITLGKDIDYEIIRKRDFGVIIQSILDKNCLKKILKTFPNNIKLSDWRNIAYHHTYEIQKDKIKCYYGKKSNNFEISLKELQNYAVAVIKSSNIIDIARRIFLYDNYEIFSNISEDLVSVCDREVMRVGQLRTAFLGQGFKLLDMKISDECQEAIIVDLETNLESTDEKKLQRRIHCIQFLYNIWAEFPAKRISIVYCDNTEKGRFRYSIEGGICQKISKELIEFSEMFKFVTIEIL